MWQQSQFVVETTGRGFTELTSRIGKLVASSQARIGVCHVFLSHTSASLCITENADPEVRVDLESLASRWAPDGAAFYSHDAEGPDDMSAHARTLLAGSQITVPVVDRHLHLGTWQGIYLWEHRTGPHRRSVVVTIQGEV